MIKAEIQKNSVVYVADLTSLGGLKSAYEFARKVATGQEVLESDQQILDLGSSENYDHIRVYIEEDPMAVGPKVDPAAPVDYPVEDQDPYLRAFRDKLTFLGNTVEVGAVKSMSQGREYILVYEVNGEPALLTVTRVSLEKLAEHVGRTQMMNNPTVLMQPADLHDEEEALEYMMDYVATVNKENADLAPEDHTAVAYPAFNKDEE